MSTVYKNKLPSGLKPEDFKYHGRASKDQGDFGDDVGIADMACVDQFGKNSNKHYHVGVLVAQNRWFSYFEWGRISGGKSWEGRTPENYWFVEFESEIDARDAFRKKCLEKNLKRLEQKDIAGTMIWVAKPKKDAYIVQSLATRERGLPDAYIIKDSSGITESKKKTVTKQQNNSVSTNTYQPQVIDLARDLVGGVQSYARAATAATGVTPTFDSITKVRDVYLLAALNRIVEITKLNPKDRKESDDEYDLRIVDVQIGDNQMQDISKLVAALVPRVLPRGRASAKEIILSSNNVLSVQQDLDAFEANLKNEDFDVEVQDTGIDPEKLLNAKLNWVDPNTTKGRWLNSTFLSTYNPISYSPGKIRIKNTFEVVRYDRDLKFVDNVKKISDKNKNKAIVHSARRQPSSRDDISDISDYYKSANVFLGFHGTRSVNVSPILSSNFRLPKALPGAQITGAAFGHGCYIASSYSKAINYTSAKSSYYSSGNGGIKNRGFFIFMIDAIMGDAYMATHTGSWSSPPNNKDSIAAYPEFCYSLQNDEHIIFDPNYQRIRYLVECDLV